MECRNLIKHVNPKMRKEWTQYFKNELGNIAQGVKELVKGTNTIFFIKHREMTADLKGTYTQIVVGFCQQKCYSS